MNSAARSGHYTEAMEAAAVAAGDASGDALARMVQQGKAKRQSYEDVMQRFITQRVQDHEDWMRPNRRWQHIYMPSRGGIGIQTIAFIVDISVFSMSI